MLIESSLWVDRLLCGELAQTGLSLAVLTGLAEPDPVTRSGKNKHGGRYLKSGTL